VSPSPLAIHRLRHARVLDAARVARFLSSNSFPIIEGPHCTFVWLGAADAVNLRHFVFGLPSSMPMHRVGGTDLWFCTIELPTGSRLEYKFDVVRGDHHEWIVDPRNPNIARDPFGGNSVCQAEGYEAPAWIEPDPEARPGTLEDVTLPETPFGEPRTVTIYLPARFRRTRRYPVLFVHDGGDYLRFAALKPILDNLIHRGEMAPLIAVLLHPGQRLVEYPDDPRHVAFVADQLLPWVEAQYPTYGQPAMRCLMGASFGAVASLSTAWRRPGVFGRLLVQSGSFAFTDLGDHKRGPAFDPVVKFVNAFREEPGVPSEKVFQSCGTYETLIYENRSMVPVLRGTGMDVRYVEARDGHNWENWRDRLREGLTWLFPGPLWMVYE
jgi:enterochelin esterase-like enzyme